MPVFEEWKVKDGQKMLCTMVEILVARRMTDRHLGEPGQEWLTPYLDKVVELEVEFPTPSAADRFAARPQLTVRELLQVMKINYELSDACTLLMQQVHKHAAVTKKNKFLVSYMMSRFTGRKFLEYLAEYGPEGSTVESILRAAWDKMAREPDFTGADFFSDGFNPQKRHGHTARHMTRECFLSLDTLKNTFHVSPRPTRVNLKNGENQPRDKREVMKQLRKQRGCGPFVAKNCYRILSNWKPSSLKGYSECGSGARAFLLLWKGYPQGLLASANTQDASDFFNVLLGELATALNRVMSRMIREATGEEKRYLGLIKAELTQSLEAVQFVCCEGIKILRYLITRSRLYLRRGLPQELAADEEEDMAEIENDASDVD